MGVWLLHLDNWNKMHWFPMRGDMSIVALVTSLNIKFERTKKYENWENQQYNHDSDWIHQCLWSVLSNNNQVSSEQSTVLINYIVQKDIQNQCSKISLWSTKKSQPIQDLYVEKLRTTNTVLIRNNQFIKVEMSFK